MYPSSSTVGRRGLPPGELPRAQLEDEGEEEVDARGCSGGGGARQGRGLAGWSVHGRGGGGGGLDGSPAPTTHHKPHAASSSSSRPHLSPLRRSRTAPTLPNLSSLVGTHQIPTFPPVHNFALLLLLLYLASGIAAYVFARDHFSSLDTHPIVDALYFSIVTMCTIGYGDITPTSPLSKLFSIVFAFLGFGFIYILLGATLSHLLHLQEQLLLGANHVVFYAEKGRVRIRLKVATAMMAVVLCVGAGTCVLHRVEELGWLDSFYLAVMSVTTVGYGDHTFKTLGGRLFACAWLLLSTLAVARAFMYLAEARVNRRHRRIAEHVLRKGMTVAEFLAADINDNAFLCKSEFVIYKLKEMGKISEKDVSEICRQFRKMDVGNCGKIKLNDLLADHLH